MSSHQRDFDTVPNQRAHEALILKVLNDLDIDGGGGGSSSFGTAIVSTWHPNDGEEEIKPLDQFEGSFQIVRNGTTPTVDSFFHIQVTSYSNNAIQSTDPLILNGVITPADIEAAFQDCFDQDPLITDGSVTVTGDTWTGAASDDVLWTVVGEGFQTSEVGYYDGIPEGMLVFGGYTAVGSAAAMGFYLDLSPVPNGAIVEKFYAAVIDDIVLAPDQESMSNSYSFLIFPMMINDLRGDLDDINPYFISALVQGGVEEDTIFQLQAAESTREQHGMLVAQGQQLPASTSIAGGDDAVAIAGEVDIICQYIIPPRPITTTSTEWDNNGD